MKGWRSPRLRRALVIAVIAALPLGAFVPAALATTVNFFGYANLTANNPPASSCFSGSVAGLACSGWTEWDYSQAGWNSGHSGWTLGFLCQADFTVHGRLFLGYEGFDTYTAQWSDYCPGHYNRAVVEHVNDGNGSYNYLQGRGLKFPDSRGRQNHEESDVHRWRRGDYRCRNRRSRGFLEQWRSWRDSAATTVNQLWNANGTLDIQ